MGLFPKWEGEVELPPLSERKMRIGSNWVVQRLFSGAIAKAKISDSQYSGHDLVVTKLDPPYREFLLRRKGAHRIETPMPTVTSPDITDPNELPARLSLKWDAFGELETYADTPEKVLLAWTNKFDFRTEDETVGLPGLRTLRSARFMPSPLTLPWERNLMRQQLCFPQAPARPRRCWRRSFIGACREHSFLSRAMRFAARLVENSFR